MSYDTHCSSCGMPYSDFAREGAKSCECHKMAAQAVRDFVFDKPALSASPVAQEPAWRYEIQHGPDGETDWAWVYDAENNLVCTAKTYHAAAIVRASSPPATPAGVGVDEIARIIEDNCSVRVQGEYHAPHEGLNEAATAILALLSRGSGSDQQRSHEEQSTQNI